jgi:hypothetical protein
MAGLLWIAPTIAQTAFTPRDESPQDFPAGLGRDETFYACTACHGFKLVAQQGMTRAQWEDSINLMIRRHDRIGLPVAAHESGYGPTRTCPRLARMSALRGGTEMPALAGDV